MAYILGQAAHAAGKLWRRLFTGAEPPHRSPKPCPKPSRAANDERGFAHAQRVSLLSFGDDYW